MVHLSSRGPTDIDPCINDKSLVQQFRKSNHCIQETNVSVRVILGGDFTLNGENRRSVLLAAAAAAVVAAAVVMAQVIFSERPKSCGDGVRATGTGCSASRVAVKWRLADDGRLWTALPRRLRALGCWTTTTASGHGPDVRVQIARAFLAGREPWGLCRRGEGLGERTVYPRATGVRSPIFDRFVRDTQTSLQRPRRDTVTRAREVLLRRR